MIWSSPGQAWLTRSRLHHPADCLHEGRLDGKIELRTGRIELASAVNHAVEAARPLCKSRDYELTVTLPSEPVFGTATRCGWRK
jgi:hypothetical protein